MLSPAKGGAEEGKVPHNCAESREMYSHLLELFYFLIETFKTTTRFQPPLKM